MDSCIRIEQLNSKYTIILDYWQTSYELETRETYRDAEDFAFYFARRIRLDVYFRGEKLCLGGWMRLVQVSKGVSELYINVASKI